MRTIDEATLVAYVDGELEAAERAEVERLLKAEPALAARAAQHRRLRAAAAQVHAEALHEPVPQRLLDAAGRSERRTYPVVDRPFDARGAGRGRFGLAQWAAMAASLAIGVFVGRALAPQETPAGPRGAGGFLVADGAGRLSAGPVLAAALDEQLAGEGGEEAAIRLGFSFRTDEPAYCRTFQIVESTTAGVACRQAEGWDVRMLTPGRPEDRHDLTYRMAASPMPPAILVAVDRMIAGEPLSSSEEAAARAQNWVE